jgi:cysteinyl-tRNA synthetase
MVRLECEKMAKSVGNIRLLHKALDAVGRDTLVMYFVSGHYRQPLVYTEDALADARGSVERVHPLGVIGKDSKCPVPT